MDRRRGQWVRAVVAVLGVVGSLLVAVAAGSALAAAQATPVVLTDQMDGLCCTEVTPDGTHVVATSGNHVDDQSVLKSYDALTGAEVATLSGPGKAFVPAAFQGFFSPELSLWVSPDSTEVVFRQTTFNGGGLGPVELVVAPVDGSSAPVVLHTETGTERVSFVGFDEVNGRVVFGVTANTFLVGFDEIRSVPFAGGTPTVVTGAGSRAVVAGGAVVWFDPSGITTDLVATDTVTGVDLVLAADVFEHFADPMVSGDDVAYMKTDVSWELVALDGSSTTPTVLGNVVSDIDETTGRFVVHDQVNNRLGATTLADPAVVTWTTLPATFNFVRFDPAGDVFYFGTEGQTGPDNIHMGLMTGAAVSAAVEVPGSATRNFIVDGDQVVFGEPLAVSVSLFAWDPTQVALTPLGATAGEVWERVGDTDRVVFAEIGGSVIERSLQFGPTADQTVLGPSQVIGAFDRQPVTEPLVSETVGGGYVVVDNVGFATCEVAPADCTGRVRLVPGSVPAPAVTFLSNPARLMDTRATGGTVDGLAQGDGVRTAGSVTVLSVAGRAGIGQGDAGVALNVTAVAPSAAGFVNGGFLSVYPCNGTAPPNPVTATLNMAKPSGSGSPVRAVANNANVKLDLTGSVCIFVNHDAHVVVDVAGTYPAGSPFVPIVAQRYVDTRGQGTVDGLFNSGGATAATTTIAVQIEGRPGVGTGAIGAVAMNVAAVAPAGGGSNGFVKAWPCDAPEPAAAFMNFAGSTTAVANSGIIGVATSGADAGKVCVTTNVARELVIDVTGYYLQGQGVVPTTPARLLDTRGPSAPTVDGQFNGTAPFAKVPAGTWTTVDLTGRAGSGIPATGVGAVVLNAVAVQPSATGFATVVGGPCPTAAPSTATLNFVGGANAVANGAIVKVPASGEVCVYNNQDTHLIIDTTGWFPG